MGGGPSSCLDEVTSDWNFFFFFSSRRRHTRLQGDWSSDVCSSDLLTWMGTLIAVAAIILWRGPLMRMTTDTAAGQLLAFGVVLGAEAQALVVAEDGRSEEHTSELQSPCNLVCRLLLEKKKNKIRAIITRCATFSTYTLFTTFHIRNSSPRLCSPLG